MDERDSKMSSSEYEQKDCNSIEGLSQDSNLTLHLIGTLGHLARYNQAGPPSHITRPLSQGQCLKISNSYI